MPQQHPYALGIRYRHTFPNLSFAFRENTRNDVSTQRHSFFELQMFLCIKTSEKTFSPLMACAIHGFFISSVLTPFDVEFSLATRRFPLSSCNNDLAKREVAHTLPSDITDLTQDQIGSEARSTERK